MVERVDSVQCYSVLSPACVCLCVGVACAMGKSEDPVICYGRQDLFGVCVV